MTTVTERQLVVNITVSNTWTQLLEGAGGSAYAVPSGARAEMRLISARNLGANSAVVDFAISTDSTISDVERFDPSPTLLTGEFAMDNAVYIIRALEGVWVRATGTSPNVSFRASILEVVP